MRNNLSAKSTLLLLLPVAVVAVVVIVALCKMLPHA
jgi:hypothetical protein